MSDLDYMKPQIERGALRQYWKCGQAKPTPGHPLTKTETEVLRWVVRGLSNAQIAKIVGCMEGTVKTHLSVIYVKYGVGNRVQATRKYYGIKDDDAS